jgi:hypothetical protein
MTLRRFAVCCLLVVECLTVSAPVAKADGVTAYLPLNLEPEIERQIERVLILADEPILKRPFAVALVADALPQACRVDAYLCHRVKRYLERYSRDYAVTHASATGTLTHGSDTGVVPNSYGLPVESKWELSGEAYVQPTDYFLAAAGAVAYAGRTVPVGSMLSFGTNWAQVDVGYRNHWLSPMVDSSTLVSTEAPTMPSVTVSNYEPISRLGFQYELFLARMSESDHISYDGREARGTPHLFGAQFSIEPFSGWSIGVNRLLQYGGGAGLPDSASFLVRDFFKPSGQSQNQGNQQASYVSRFIFPTKVPFAVYFQYAGENTEDGGSYLLGNAALSAGIDLPRVGKYLDMTYEISEWQNTWYTNFIFLDGMTNYGLVDGNWGADQRMFNSGIGARSQMLRIGWLPDFGGYLEERVRTLVNQDYAATGEARTYSNKSPFPYHRYVDFTLTYSRPWNETTVGGQLMAGRDVFGQSFVRLSGFLRYGGDSRTRDDGSVDDETSKSGSDSTAQGGRLMERFVDFGVGASIVHIDIQPTLAVVSTKAALDPHFGVGARREVADRNDLGVRLEFDKANGHDLIGVRALDYRHRFASPVALGVFVGAARYDLATPAYSIYYGSGLQFRDMVPGWDVNLELRHAQNLARDHLLATDQQGPRPDSFYKVDSALVYLSRKF